MLNYLLLTEADTQQALAGYLRQQRKQLKLSRHALAERSTVPASTIKKFELSGQISLRQFLLLWESLDDLRRIYALTQAEQTPEPVPQTIEDVLRQ
ncbi:MAG: helix-turn-helix transcriptional regulator [Thiolinea sp.]